jgi:hypothetical protein
MVENLCLLFQDVNTVYIDRFGSLQDWINEANDEGYWTQIVSRLLHPATPIPERPETWGPLPSWHTRRATGGKRPPDRDADNDDDDEEDDSNDCNDDNRHHREGHRDHSRQRDRHHSPPSPRSPPIHEQQPQSNPPNPTEYNPKRWLNDDNFCAQVGHSMSQSLTILGLGFGASETEIRVHYGQLSRKYHPDKNSPAITGLSASEASTFFQLLNNAHEYLKDRA